MGKQMRYGFKLDPDNPDHIAVARILDDLDRYEKRNFLVAAVLAYHDSQQKDDNSSAKAVSTDDVRSIVEEMLNAKKEQTPVVKKQSGSEKEHKLSEVHEETKGNDEGGILKGLGGFRGFKK